MSKKTFIVAIEDIENAPEKVLHINFEEFISELKSNELVKANLEITALGDFIEVWGDAKGSVILECDRCLSEFEYKFDIEIEEMFAKNSLSQEYGSETELKEGQFVTDLVGKDIDIYDLLYQSVILDLPNKQVCGINCKGDKFLMDENLTEIEPDPRLAVFKNINTEKKKPKK